MESSSHGLPAEAHDLALAEGRDHLVVGQEQIDIPRTA